MNLNEVSFPVYKLGETKPNQEGGLSYYEYRNTGEVEFKKKIVDDLSLPGKTLALRRLNIPQQDKFNISKAIFFLGDLIKLARASSWFVDSKGKIFNYTKTTFVPLLCKKISKIIDLPGATGKVIEVEGVSTRFKTLFAPPASHAYCLLLKTNNGFIFYGTTQDKCRDTRRKI